MRPIIVGFSGAEALTALAHIDVQIDQDEDLLKRTQDGSLRDLLRAQLTLMYSLRSKFDKAMDFRANPLPAPF
jgi:hypothetical protein